MAAVRQRYLEACNRSREIAAEHDLDEIFDWRGTAVNLRFLYAHLLTELARHAGHGEILVEQAAGRAAERANKAPERPPATRHAPAARHNRPTQGSRSGHHL